MTLPTADGGRLAFHASGKPDPAEGLPTVHVDMLAAVRPINREDRDDNAVFDLITTMVDSEGRLWQRARTVTTWELWRGLLVHPQFYPLCDRRKAENCTRRELLEPVHTMCDMRERYLIEVSRETNPALTLGSPGYADSVERLVFRLRFKYFAAWIGLTEERTSVHNRITNELSWLTDLVWTIRPLVSTELIVALNNNDQVLPAKECELPDLGILCSRRTGLRAGWEDSYGELPRIGNRSEWEKALQDAGGDPATMKPLKPHPGVRYEAAAAPGAKSL